MKEPKWTHYGWWGICPVVYAALESEAPIVGPRHWALEPLFWISEAVSVFVNIAGTAMNPEFEPGFAFKITGLYE